MTHTPTPWFQDSLYVTNRDDGLIGPSIADCGKSPRIERSVQVANAAFIVRAVNNHQALLEALSAATCELSHCATQLAARGLKGHPDDSVSRALKSARAALTAASPPVEQAKTEIGPFPEETDGYEQIGVVPRQAKTEVEG